MTPLAIDTLVRHVLGEACERGLRLATAESCTGGLVASLLTDVEGCSHAFACGIVSYSDESKTDLLGVDPAVLKSQTAVSQAVARAMALGALARAPADVAVSVTGYADGTAPGSTAGLVHFAAAGNARPTVSRVETFGDLGREVVRTKAVYVALELFRAQIV